MRKGFIFDHTRCVNCNACNAACILENGWKGHPRNIYTYNSQAEPGLPLLHLSLACNHCESAACMDGCPTSAYSREPVTGAIILDEARCIGCRYCQWNCPYDAPKYNSETRSIIKCNLCYSLLIEGLQPACSSGCPTGALRYGEFTEHNSGPAYSWFPDKELNPAIEFTAKSDNTTLKIIPENIYESADQVPSNNGKNISDEWSLIAFSYLATLSVSAIISAFIKGIFPPAMVFLPVLLLTGAVSFFHLGQKIKAWRSLINLRNSALSREIAAFIVFASVSVVTVLFHIPGFLIVSSITGLTLLLLIDNVYVTADKRLSVVLHSGQTFISALLIVSFFTDSTLPFLFMALIKLVSSFYRLPVKQLHKQNFGLRFLRIAFLIVSGISMVSDISYPDLFIVSLFLIGELFDRILFYIDFNPLNIYKLIDQQLNTERNEKKRG